MSYNTNLRGSTIFVSGPMRGRRHFNRVNFNRVDQWLQSKYGVPAESIYNPVRADTRIYGSEVFDSALTGSIDEIPEVADFNLSYAMGDCIRFIEERADTIVLLNGWQNSVGAKKELSSALMCGLDIVLEREL